MWIYIKHQRAFMFNHFGLLQRYDITNFHHY